MSEGESPTSNDEPHELQRWAALLLLVISTLFTAFCGVCAWSAATTKFPDIGSAFATFIGGASAIGGLFAVVASFKNLKRKWNSRRDALKRRAAAKAQT